jgi:hypothetical protein
MQGGADENRDAEGMALAYYYSMIGLAMSVKLYDREQLLCDARAAWNGLRLGLQLNTAK